MSATRDLLGWCQIPLLLAIALAALLLLGDASALSDDAADAVLMAWERALDEATLVED
jgi:hypothetical protein